MQPLDTELPLDLSRTKKRQLRAEVRYKMDAPQVLWQWFDVATDEQVAHGSVQLSPGVFGFRMVNWTLYLPGEPPIKDNSAMHGTGMISAVRRWLKLLPMADLKSVHFWVIQDPSFEIGHDIAGCTAKTDHGKIGAKLEYFLKWHQQTGNEWRKQNDNWLIIELATMGGYYLIEWWQKGQLMAKGEIRTLSSRVVTWTLTQQGRTSQEQTSTEPGELESFLPAWIARVPGTWTNGEYHLAKHFSKAGLSRPGETFKHNINPDNLAGKTLWGWFAVTLQSIILEMRQLLKKSEDEAPPELLEQLRKTELGDVFQALSLSEMSHDYRRDARHQQELERVAEGKRRMAELRAAKEAAEKKAKAKAQPVAKPSATGQDTRAPLVAPAQPLPDVAIRMDLEWPAAIPDEAQPMTVIDAFLLREQAALWWVSNQSDDLICLPLCHVRRLEYQVRSALRVMGPLRGRALLSDEVGLGKTIEAGLVLKEYLTRGMARRWLVLTVPSLVDQWEEELAEKFNLTARTTNHAEFKSDPAAAWRDSPGIIASLHTLKQPAHLAEASKVKWDVLIVDEAHYLRNRTSVAFQAVSALPRQYMLLLTATPVQNSLEELYNLVTLLQPGQLPPPKEFKKRYFDPEFPRKPKEPEELRRLLSQLMVRNTRANAGVDLPPRQAETVMFTPTPAELIFWTQWEGELRTALAALSASQAQLWGRLLLQAAGSSPEAWRSSLGKFPDAKLARRWAKDAPLAESWAKKCALVAPLARAERGCVLFTQFRHTQDALAEFLRKEKIPCFVLHGGIPAADRQGVAEAFREARHGVLLLTKSGTEGRNLQFCHRLINFDLPWNPMEIEQRIGRLHRLGQERPVSIYNFVQEGTLQEALLNLLQEKLNLFELVVGETGLILGERYSGDEFGDEILRRWREGEADSPAAALASLGDEIMQARSEYAEVKSLDETLFAGDYEAL